MFPKMSQDFRNKLLTDFVRVIFLPYVRALIELRVIKKKQEKELKERREAIYIYTFETARELVGEWILRASAPSPSHSGPASPPSAG